MSEEPKGGEGEPKKDPAEKTDEKTVGEIIDDTVGDPKDPAEGDDPKDPDPTAETVPLATFLSTKKDAKKFEKLYNDLKTKSEKGDSSPEEIAEDLDALAEEFEIDPKFVKKLAKILEGKAEKKVGESMKPILEQNKKYTEKEKQEAIDKAFTKHYDAALETLPEYADIANAEVIKALSLLPANKDKTFVQLIEETYSKAITGKRTIEPTKPGGGKDPEPIDYEKARNDTKYFESIMADPAKKKEYNEHMLAPKNRRS